MYFCYYAGAYIEVAIFTNENLKEILHALMGLVAKCPLFQKVYSMFRARKGYLPQRIHIL